MAGKQTASKTTGGSSKPISSGIKKNGMRTRQQSKQTEQAQKDLEKEMNNLTLQADETRKEINNLKSQVDKAQRKLNDPEIADSEKNEADYKKLLDLLKGAEETEEQFLDRLKGIKGAKERFDPMEVDQSSTELPEEADPGATSYNQNKETKSHTAKSGSRGGSQHDFARTRTGDESITESFEDRQSKPSDYADIAPIEAGDLTEDDGDPTEDDVCEENLLDDGVTILRTTRLHLNSYGPKNSAMLTWGSAPANKVVENLTNIHGKPHNQALIRDNENGRYLYKGNIRRILSIAWKPRRKIKNMADLLESVEELNPDNKAKKGYRFPFSTVLVEGINIGRVWIDRTGYRILTSTAKKEKERTDRKFYQIACLQVNRYRDLIGETRLGKERTPTPLEESPEPQGSSRNGQGTPAQQSGPAQSRQSQREPYQSEGGQSEQGQNGQGQSEQGQSGQGQSGQGQSAMNQNGQSAINHRNDKPRKISSFYESWLNENKLPKGTAPGKLSQEEFGKLKAAAHSYVDKYTADTGCPVEDDLNILE